MYDHGPVYNKTSGFCDVMASFRICITMKMNDAAQITGNLTASKFRTIGFLWQEYSGHLSYKEPAIWNTVPYYDVTIVMHTAKHSKTQCQPVIIYMPVRL